MLLCLLAGTLALFLRACPPSYESFVSEEGRDRAALEFSFLVVTRKFYEEIIPSLLPHTLSSTEALTGAGGTSGRPVPAPCLLDQGTWPATPAVTCGREQLTAFLKTAPTGKEIRHEVDAALQEVSG